MIINNRGDGGAHQRVTGFTRQMEEKKEEFLRAGGPNKGSTRGSRGPKKNSSFSTVAAGRGEHNQSKSLTVEPLGLSRVGNGNWTLMQIFSSAAKFSRWQEFIAALYNEENSHGPKLWQTPKSITGTTTSMYFFITH